MIDAEGTTRVNADRTRTRTANHDNPRTTIYVRPIRYRCGGLQTVLTCDSVCRRPGYLPLRSIIHSFQLRAYEQGTRARLSQTEDDLRALRRERDDALRDLNANREQAQVWVAEVDKWKSEVCSSLPHCFGLDSPYTRRRRIER